MTIHIFAYGECQLIDKDFNFKTSVSDVNSLQPLIAEIKKLKPTDIIQADYHCITINDKANSRYASKGKDGSFQFKIANIKASKLSDFVAEMTELKQAKEVNNEQ